MKFSSFSKILFDVIMLVLLVVVYTARSTGTAAHEYIGLAIYLLFIIHLAYYYKWIINVGKRLFDKNFSARQKFMYLVNFLLLFGFILIGLSGIMISRVVFKIDMPLWRPLHTVSSAFTVILLAIHLGLHWKMIINAVKTKAKSYFRFIQITATIIFAAILIAGVYGDVALKIQSPQDQMSRRLRYETVLGLFERSIYFLTSSPEDIRNRLERSGYQDDIFGDRMNGRGRNGQMLRSPESGNQDDMLRNRMNGREGRNGRSLQSLETDNQNEMFRDRMNGRDRNGDQRHTFNTSTLLISVSNFIAFIILTSIIVFLVDSVIRKKVNLRTKEKR